MTVKLVPTALQAQMIAKSIAEPTRAILNASDVGTGKTLCAVETTLQAGWGRVLIIGIKDTAGQWAHRFAAQSDGAVQVRVIDGTKGGKANLQGFLAGEPGIYFSGLQYVVRQDWDHRDKLDHEGDPIPAIDRKTGLPTGKMERQRVHLKTYAKMKAPLDALIVDESHLISSRKSVSLTTIKSIKSAWKMAMSGTFYGNKFENAWAVTRWLWPELIPASFHRWKDDWCDVDVVRGENGKPIYKKDRNGAPTTIEEVKGERVPGAFVATLPCYFRIEKNIGATPDPKLVYVDLSPTQRAQYAQMEADMLAWLKQKHPLASDEQLAPLVAEVDIAKRQRMRTMTLGEMSLDENEEVMFADDCRSTKLDALSGVLAHYGRQKVVIYTDSKRFAKVAVRRMLRAGLSVAEWSGDVNSVGRDAIKEAFLRPLDDGGLQYIVAVITAFSTGLDGFQLACNKIVWLSEVEGNAVQNDQAVARIWRQGGDLEGFEHVKILARDTLDEGVFGKLRKLSQSMQETMRVAA